jgi:hypothetical protein
MSIVEARITHPGTGDEAQLIEDWLGLASYLAQAVAGGDVTLDAARAELAAGARGPAERRAIRRAADVAATQFGTSALITTLLRPADTHGTATAEVA